MSNSEAHDSLFDPLQRFLSQNWHYPRACQLVEPAKKLGESGVEIPDIIAWFDDRSVVIDVKVSVEDCRAHLNKVHVEHPWRGMGMWRYIAIPATMDSSGGITLPDYWGLLIVDTSHGGVHEAESAQHWPHHARNWRREMSLLQRALMKAQQGAPSGGSNGKSQTAKLTADEAAAVRNALAEMGTAELKEIARWIASNVPTKKSRQQLRSAIEDDLRTRQLTGVAVIDPHERPWRLTLAGEVSE